MLRTGGVFFSGCKKERTTTQFFFFTSLKHIRSPLSAQEYSEAMAISYTSAVSTLASLEKKSLDLSSAKDRQPKKKEGVRCFKCDKVCHKKAQCPERVDGVLRCSTCNGLGHLSSD